MKTTYWIVGTIIAIAIVAFVLFPSGKLPSEPEPFDECAIVEESDIDLDPNLFIDEEVTTIELNLFDDVNYSIVKEDIETKEFISVGPGGGSTIKTYQILRMKIDGKN